MLNAEGNIHVDDKADMITDYINFFTNLCIPLKLKKFGNHKPWMTRELLDLIDAKQQAREDGNRKLYITKLKKTIKRNKKNLEPSTLTKFRSTLEKIQLMPGTTSKNLTNLLTLSSTEMISLPDLIRQILPLLLQTQVCHHSIYLRMLSSNS